MEWLSTLSATHWFILGIVLLAGEALGAAGFLLGAAAAAFFCSVIVWVFPGLAVGLQLTLFALAATIATIVYFQLFRDAQRQRDGEPRLNERARHMIGERFELSSEVAQGVGRVQLGDTFWRVITPEAITAGTVVEVVDADDMTLMLHAVR